VKRSLDLVFLSAIVLTLAEAQQQKTDFSGHWMLDVAKCEAPVAPPEMEQVVEYKDHVLRWTTTLADANASRMMLPFLMGIADPKEQLRTDGVEETVRNGPFERTSRTVWDGHKLVTTWTMKTPQDPPEGKWVRSLSADGKMQTIDIEFRSAMMGTVQAKLVFSRR